jgi:hypothetical protein
LKNRVLKINNVDPETVDNHRIKIKQLTERMYPHFPPAKVFQRLERALGHNLFVKAIMAISKTAKNKTTLAKGIPKGQWDNFVQDKIRNRRDKPQMGHQSLEFQPQASLGSKVAFGRPASQF